MQIESILVNNNAPCLTTSHHLESGGAHGLGGAPGGAVAEPDGDSMEVLGAAASISPVLQAFPSDHLHLGGHTASCELKATAPNACSAAGLMTDWPSNWHTGGGPGEDLATTSAPPSLNMQATKPSTHQPLEASATTIFFTPLTTPTTASCDAHYANGVLSDCNIGELPPNKKYTAAEMAAGGVSNGPEFSGPPKSHGTCDGGDVIGVHAMDYYEGAHNISNIDGNKEHGAIEPSSSDELAGVVPVNLHGHMVDDASLLPLDRSHFPAATTSVSGNMYAGASPIEAPSEPFFHTATHLDDDSAAPVAAAADANTATLAPGPADESGASAAAGLSNTGSGVATDTLALELSQIMARCGGVSDPRFAGRLGALVEDEDRLGGRLTLLTVVQQSSQDVLRLFVQGSGLRSLEQWVVQFRDEGRHGALVKVIGCLKMLPIDLMALKGSSIGQTVGKLRKHTIAAVRAAASELVDQWKGVVDRSVGRNEGRQGTKSKADVSVHEGPNKRPRKSDPPVPNHTPAPAAVGSTGKPGAAAHSGEGPAASTSKLAVMDDDLFVSGGSGAGAPTAPHAPAPHRSIGLASFVSGMKKVHSMKLENLVPGRPGSLQGPGAATASTAGAVDAAAPAGDEAGLPSPGSPSSGALSPQGSGDFAGVPASTGSAATAVGPDGKPAGASYADVASSSGAAAAGLMGGGSVTGVEAALGSAVGASTSGSGVPRPMSLPRLGTLSGPSTPTVRLGSLRDGSLPTAGIARLGTAAGVGGRAGTAASLPAAVAPGGPQSAHARAMAARARAPSPEPAPRKEKRKSVSWAGDEALASYRLFKKDDPPQLAAADAVITAEDEAAAAADPAGGAPGGVLQPPGFQSAARREHASERMALFAQHQQEEQERLLEMERLAALRPTVPWIEPPELFLGAVPQQQLPALGDESREREVQARIRQTTPRVMYHSPAQIPHSPAEPPPEPEPDPFRVRHIPLNVHGMLPPSVGGLYGGGVQPPPVGGPLVAGGPHPGFSCPPSHGMGPYVVQPLPPPPPLMHQQPPSGHLQPKPTGVPPQQPQQQQQQGAALTLPPDLVASLPGLINTLSQQQPQQQPLGLQAGQGPPGPGVGPPPGQGPVAGQGPQPGMPPPPQHGPQHPHSQQPQPHSLPPPHPRGVGGQPGGPPLMQPGGPMMGPPGGPGRPLEYGMLPPHQGMGPGAGPGGMPAGQGRPGSRFEPGPGQGQGQGMPPPPPPPRKEGQPTVMRPRRADDPQGPGPLGPQHQHPGWDVPGPPHMVGPLHGMRHLPPHGHPHGMGPPGPGPGPGGGPGGWAPPPGHNGSGGGGGGPPAGAGMSGGPLPPPPGHGPGGKVCAYFNTPGGCRNGDGCRFLHIHPQDAGPPYDGGHFPGMGRGGMGRPGGGPPPGMQSGGRRR